MEHPVVQLTVNQWGNPMLVRIQPAELNIHLRTLEYVALFAGLKSRGQGSNPWGLTKAQLVKRL